MSGYVCHNCLPGLFCMSQPCLPDLECLGVCEDVLGQVHERLLCLGVGGGLAQEDARLGQHLRVCTGTDRPRKGEAGQCLPAHYLYVWPNMRGGSSPRPRGLLNKTMSLADEKNIHPLQSLKMCEWSHH